MGVVNRILAFIGMGLVGIFTIAWPIKLLVITAAQKDPDSSSPGLFLLAAPYLAVCVATVLIAGTAPTGRRAWGQLALVNGLACFALPFAGFALVVIIGHPVGAVATGFVGLAMFGVLGLIGFFAGLILVTIAYFVLRSAPGRNLVLSDAGEDAALLRR
jgi:hypothetical protein